VTHEKHGACCLGHCTGFRSWLANFPYNVALGVHFLLPVHFGRLSALAVHFSCVSIRYLGELDFIETNSGNRTFHLITDVFAWVDCCGGRRRRRQQREESNHRLPPSYVRSF
jgi:hypothetical protein